MGGMVLSCSRMATNYYETLGVSRNASEKDIRTAYRRLARKLHPDVNPSDKASEGRFKEVNAAFDVLSDAEKRRKYDRYGDAWEHADELERQQRARGRCPHALLPLEWASLDFDEADLGDLFGGLFGGGQGRGARGRPRDLNVEQPIEVTLEEAFAGTTRTLLVGGEDGPSRRLEGRIPPGVVTGSRVRLAGEGREGFEGRRGDLYLVVTVRPHERFERKGDDLHTEVEAPLTAAVLGGEVEVQALDKKGGAEAATADAERPRLPAGRARHAEAGPAQAARRPLRQRQGAPAGGAGRRGASAL